MFFWILKHHASIIIAIRGMKLDCIGMARKANVGMHPLVPPTIISTPERFALASVFDCECGIARGSESIPPRERCVTVFFVLGFQPFFLPWVSKRLTRVLARCVGVHLFRRAVARDPVLLHVMLNNGTVGNAQRAQANARMHSTIRRAVSHNHSKLDEGKTTRTHHGTGDRRCA